MSNPFCRGLPSEDNGRILSKSGLISQFSKTWRLSHLCKANASSICQRFIICRELRSGRRLAVVHFRLWSTRRLRFKSPASLGGPPCLCVSSAGLFAWQRSGSENRGKSRCPCCFPTSRSRTCQDRQLRPTTRPKRPRRFWVRSAAWAAALATRQNASTCEGGGGRRAHRAQSQRRTTMLKECFCAHLLPCRPKRPFSLARRAVAAAGAQIAAVAAAPCVACSLLLGSLSSAVPAR